MWFVSGAGVGWWGGRLSTGCANISKPAATPTLSRCLSLSPMFSRAGRALIVSFTTRVGHTDSLEVLSVAFPFHLRAACIFSLSFLDFAVRRFLLGVTCFLSGCRLSIAHHTSHITPVHHHTLPVPPHYQMWPVNPLLAAVHQQLLLLLCYSPA